MVEERLPTSHFLVLNQCNGWVSAPDSEADAHTLCVSCIYTHPLIKKPCPAMPSVVVAPRPFLPHRRWMSWNLTLLVKLHPPHISAAQLDSAMEQRWIEHHFSVKFNCSFVLCAVVHDEDPHAAPLIMTWTSSRRRDLKFPASFSLGKPRRWQSDRIILKWRMTTCFQPSTGALLIYVMEEWEWSCSFSVHASH